MKVIVFVMYICFILPVQPDDMERHAYCESCLIAAREIEKSLKETSTESRRRVIEGLISGGVCEKLLSHKHVHVSKGKITSSCMHLFEAHYAQFHTALLNKEPKHLDILLCYEQSTACVGVKHTSFQGGEKSTFTNSDIEALLKDNKENVRIARPVHSGLPVHSDEL